MSGLRAGIARVELTPAHGLPMMGYAVREGGATTTEDPLYARALYLASDESAVLIVELDLCLVATVQADETRRRIVEQTGIAIEGVLVGCTHTHSGPDTGVAAVVYHQPTPEYVAPLFDAAVEAARRACGASEPARLGAGRAEARIGRIRSGAGGDFDPSVGVLRVDRADGSPLAVVFVHGCHPTVLGHDSLAWSADWPGAACRSIEAALPGAMAMFVLGAHGDVDPRTRGLQDLAVADRSRGVQPAEMEALGRELGEAVAARASEIETTAGATVGARRERVRLPVHGGADVARRDAYLEARRAEALAALDLPDDADVGGSELYKVSEERTHGLAPEEARDRIGRVRLYQRDLDAPVIAGGLSCEVEVQLLEIGPIRWLALPLEICTEVAKEWRRRVGSENADVVSIANGWLRYLPPTELFEAPDAHHRYEVLQSTFAPEAADRLLEAAEQLATSSAAASPPGR